MMSRMRLMAVPLALALSGVAASPVMADTGGTVTGITVRIDGGWAVMSGAYLKATLDGWCRAAGWTLIWDSSSDYRLQASAVFHEDFEGAVAHLIDSIYVNNPELNATLYRGNKVLHIEEQPLTSN